MGGYVSFRRYLICLFGRGMRVVGGGCESWDTASRMGIPNIPNLSALDGLR